MIWPPHSGQPFASHKVCGKLLADHAAHFANGLHAADQVLLDVHRINTSKLSWDELSVDVLQQGAVCGNGLLNLFFCGFAHNNNLQISAVADEKDERIGY